MICVETLPKVREEYAVYESFLEQNKISEQDPVFLTRNADNVAYVGRSNLQMGWAGFACHFEATKSPKLQTKYSLKIRAEFFGEKPCFRFCSRGQTHINPETGDGLPARKVHTPHFHRVDTHGMLCAYQTPELADPEESARIIASPQLGTNLFCQEANLFSNRGAFVALEIIATQLDLSTDDPLAGANFPQQ